MHAIKLELGFFLDYTDFFYYYRNDKISASPKIVIKTGVLSLK